ncbi:hypothetical protein ACFWXO_22065 [Kitasatospora sp. NPDC059088]|uniref:hypothetical protein n=1 Tax=Kitasatospora sp. NPDC059088 TaxID=3346722 RepID=UPI0036A10998
MWKDACLLLAPLAARPAYGLPADKAADRLRLTARTAQPDLDVALVLMLKLAYQVRGRGAAGEVWAANTTELRRTAIMHLLIMISAAVGYHGRRLSPEGTVALVRRAIPASPGAAG